MSIVMEIKELYITASLAQLDLSETEAIKLSSAVTKMLDYFSIMKKIDVDNLEPTTHVILKKNRLREDSISNKNDSDTLLENAPELEDRFIVIPNVL